MGPDVEHNPDGSWRGSVRMVKRKDYTGGSIRARISECNSEAELRAYQAICFDLAESGRMSRDTLGKCLKQIERRLLVEFVKATL